MWLKAGKAVGRVTVMLATARLSGQQMSQGVGLMGGIVRRGSLLREALLLTGSGARRVVSGRPGQRPTRRAAPAGRLPRPEGAWLPPGYVPVFIAPPNGFNFYDTWIRQRWSMPPKGCTGGGFLKKHPAHGRGDSCFLEMLLRPTN